MSKAILSDVTMILSLLTLGLIVGGLGSVIIKVCQIIGSVLF